VRITLLTGDCRDVLPTLPSNSVHCVVCSPPYYALRSYLDASHPDKHRELGSEATPDEYLAAMVGVFREVRRVLRQDGVCFVNVGDSYASGGMYPSRSQPPSRVLACDSGGIAPEGSPVFGSACSDLCGECRDGLLSRNGHRRALLEAALHREHEGANHPSAVPAYALASTTQQSLQQPQASNSPASSQGARCLLCVRSLADDAPASAHMEECKPGSERNGSASHNQDTDALDLAYSTIASHRYKPKDLMLMPARLALALQADGWWVRSDIIWAKPNPMPESCTDRPTSAYEHVFLLTKRARYYYDSVAVREEAEYGRREWSDISGNWKRALESSISDKRRPETATVSGGDPSTGRNLRNVWTIATHAFPEAHFATYPPELVERCIRAGTSERGCCAACGAPWVRVTERNLDNVPTRVTTKRAPIDCEALGAYLRERRQQRGLSTNQLATLFPSATGGLTGCVRNWELGLNAPMPEQWTKLKEVLALDELFDEQIYGTVEVEVTDHSPDKDPGVRTYAKAWNAEITTTGWRASCTCTAGEPVPATVLDPFLGSGTTALVADRLQRHCIGIDLSLTYADMAQRRIEQDCPLFTSWAPAEDPEDERMADLFADDEYQRVTAPAKPNARRVPAGWDTGPGAHGTIHRDGRTNGRAEAAE
jgi:DNA modification methylase